MIVKEKGVKHGDGDARNCDEKISEKLLNILIFKLKNFFRYETVHLLEEFFLLL